MLPTKKEAGFTIVELIITIAVFGLVVAGLSEVFISLDNVQRNGSYLETATIAAQTEVESLRNNNYDQLTNGQTINFTSQLPSNLPSPDSGSAVISEPITGIKRVDATVSYTQDGHTVSVELSSLIGIIGISQ
ncbi:MAG: type II secretion system protein [Candidatus Saccharimonadales bacterium]